MSQEIVLYRVFIATPSDLKSEREAAAKTLDRYNLDEAIHQQAMFLPVGWEETLRGVVRPQDRINKDLDECDYFIMLLWQRWGTPPAGSQKYSSGTEEEYYRALERKANKKYPMAELVVLFKDIDQQRMSDPGEQLSQVAAFREKLDREHRILYSTFGNIADLQERLRHELGGWLRQHVQSTSYTARQLARAPIVQGSAPTTDEVPGLAVVPQVGARRPGAALGSGRKLAPLVGKVREVPRGKRRTGVDG